MPGLINTGVPKLYALNLSDLPDTNTGTGAINYGLYVSTSNTSSTTGRAGYFQGNIYFS
jgi:hypothetical protein